MFDLILPYLFDLMSFVSGQGIQPGWEDKARLALQAGLFLFIFCVLFLWWYREQFWQTAEQRGLLWWTVGLLTLVLYTAVLIGYNGLISGGGRYSMPFVLILFLLASYGATALRERFATAGRSSRAHVRTDL